MSENNLTNKNEPDSFQKNAINTNINSVVSAGAGSGKTKVLSLRFLDLIQNRNCNVDEILTLTFTKKATVEMSSRIYKVLKENSPQQAANFYKANIKTLDSYCNVIAKYGAHFYGISPDFTHDDTQLNNKINEMAVTFILEHKDNAAIKKFITTKNYADFAESVFARTILSNTTVVDEIDFEYFFQVQKRELIEAWKKASAECLSNIDAFTNFFNSIEPSKKPSKSYLDIAEFLTGYTTPEPFDISEEVIENGKTDSLKKFSDVIQKFCGISNVGKVTSLKDAKVYYDNVKNEHAVILQQIILYIENYKHTVELSRLINIFQKSVNDFKRSSGILSFSDVSSLALKILIEHPEIRLIEKKKFKAIMIDEFQDNNQMQRDILFLLAEKIDRMEKSVPQPNELEDKLFFVGDEKQSIYRFRGADVSVFRNLSSDFKEGNLEMSNNYRSHQSLIAAFNTIFGGYKYPVPEEKKSHSAVFFTETDEENKKNENLTIPDYEAIYHKVTLPDFKKNEITEENFKSVYKSHVHFAQATDAELEAEWVALKIKKLIENGSEDLPGKKVNPGDIAILFLTYTNQSLYERMLLKHGIPYNTETVKGFFADGPVNDLFSFLKLCAYSKDTLSYAQLLRSPFVNLTVEEVNAVLMQNKEPFNKDAEQYLSVNGKKRYTKAAEFYNKIKNASKTKTLTELIDLLWYEAGYRYETIWNQKVSMYSKLYDLIFEFARNCELKNMSISAFADELRNYKDENAKLDGMDIPIVQTEGVHLMSIYKSKGLEFEVVFIPETHRKKNADNKTPLVYYNKEFGLSVTPDAPDEDLKKTLANYFYAKAHKIDVLKNNAELRRITYVALTRAVTSLYISSGQILKNDPELDDITPGAEKNLNSIYRTLFPVLNFYKENETLEFNPFTFEEISLPDTETSSNTSRRKNSSAEKLSFIEDIEKLDIYSAESNEKIITLDVVPEKYVSPSKLYHDNETISDNERKNRESLIKKFTVPEGTPYKNINDIIISTIPEKTLAGKELNPRFSFADFGTIAHSYLEAELTKETRDPSKPKYSKRNITGLENKTEQILAVENACEKMAKDFLESETGKAALNAKWSRSEFEFKYRTGKYIIHGFMDLIFENADGTYTIVDYKTNQEMKPEIYYNQLTAYREAASQILSTDPSNIKCILYYLRHNEKQDIPENYMRELDWEKLILQATM